MRSTVVNVDPHRVRDYNLTPNEVSEALAQGNTIIPAGNFNVNDSMPMVANNATVGDIPLRVGQNVYLRGIATIQDATDHT